MKGFFCSPVFRRVLFVFVAAPLALGAGDALKKAYATDDFDEVYDEAIRLGKTYGSENVLLVFDIDNTLLAMRTGLGSDQWYGWQSDMEEDDPNSVGEFSSILNVQGLLYAASSMRPTIENQPKKVNKLLKKGFPALLLTSRGYGFRDATRRELDANDYDFRKSSPLPIPENAINFFGPYIPYSEDPESTGLTEEEREDWLYEDDGSFVEPRLVSYSEGIYMTAGQNKGLMLRTLLHRLGHEGQYKAILFADDLKKHTVRMQNAFADVPVELVTFHYTAEEEAVEDFLDNVDGAQDKAAEDWHKLWVLLNEIIEPAFELPDYVPAEAVETY